MIISGGKIWFSAAELADLALPGLPKTKRKVNERAARDSWKHRVDADEKPLARRRTGRGGGWEYHFGLLPAPARAALLGQASTSDTDLTPIGMPSVIDEVIVAALERLNRAAVEIAVSRAALVALLSGAKA